MARAPLLVTSLLTFAETRAAFAKAQRMNALSASAVTWATARFIQDWSHVDVLGVDEALVVLAGLCSSPPSTCASPTRRRPRGSPQI